MTENKNFDIALFYCNKVLDMGAKDLNIFIIKLDCLNNLKKYKEAFQFCDEALNIHPNNSSILKHKERAHRLRLYSQ